MKKTFFLPAILVAAFTLCSCNANSQNSTNEQRPDPRPNNTVTADTTKIQVALLLDTSNSMDGLIDQAKSRLWDIVNTLTTLKYKGVTPKIEIALYEYGNSGLAQAENYIRQVTPMNSDLDLLSEMLFALRTNGGLEYCGAVIERAVNDIDWGTKEADMKLIYIAGNEEFNQGRVSYKEAIASALDKGIYVNTIYCGGRETGIRELWQDGATRGEGKFFNIDSDAKVRYVATPYDDKISEYNMKLNDTYVSYGTLGAEKKMLQVRQDANAKQISSANEAARAVSKSKEIYKNEAWDLVDKFSSNSQAIEELAENEIPQEYQGKSKAEIEVAVKEKQAERIKIQNEITELAKKRQAYIDAEMKKSGDGGADDLGKAINSSIITFSKTKGYEVEQ